MHDLRFLTNADVAERLAYPQLIEALRAGLAHPCEAPVRGCHALPENASLLTMPVWRPGQDIGVKLVTVFPGNGARDLPAVAALFCLFDGTHGRPLAMLEASELTARRTACTSALAADYLARRDARRLLIVGSGTLAPHMVRAHCSVREYEDIALWGRNPQKVGALVERLQAEGYPVHACADLPGSVAAADTISCVTTSREPIVLGRWLRSGCHLDLVGAFLPSMRETDNEAVRRARIVVDTREGALEEAGDLLIPMREGVIDESAIHSQISDLLQGRGARTDDSEITLFKSVGYALEDLIAARLLVQ
ncbi:ornithine cyclodeaminase family protein [Pseudomonas sp. ZM23]|uniref:Ornithine cyclodeaminase family protein n=1 Tax=Pseudomonas triclosanedens TaxID=2961893 RepID=A0ABY6ZWR0_9PSED|nr:ornithine cyclodeaminase family protein [Pseudomonas triclosanedens]MCP8465247.1 ornithine cyclodeaminase family protein [Pseudomonas triclosanedens]MCP8470813.1 ornithine cyclodeaminase family protein [Pseudomonas triclosanedens]MCP8476496.1 ornithine cyclodeaminase family protein [Pseudomonas triclosanedens]WAI48997.1 ornithine cyclodeaminase family protein [Pseudomonas triclosanedens]